MLTEETHRAWSRSHIDEQRACVGGGAAPGQLWPAVRDLAHEHLAKKEPLRKSQRRHHAYGFVRYMEQQLGRTFDDNLAHARASRGTRIVAWAIVPSFLHLALMSVFLGGSQRDLPFLVYPLLWCASYAPALWLGSAPSKYDEEFDPSVVALLSTAGSVFFPVGNILVAIAAMRLRFRSQPFLSFLGMVTTFVGLSYLALLLGDL